ncbi:flagellar biosynthesis regulator FlaF [Albibacillus kandeliae]|uniref:flagellar biosynthesis regulator FlaF n=1 Tax=Albibacillus kandeliae TaxID=2174228 RepID=UPI000D685C55|nr:flagellar biosynthesis regulator FlaF [Albibacillus kandeliae]
MSITAYRRTLREVESPRQIERRLLTTITGRMEQFAEEYDSAESSFVRLTVLSSGLREAIAENQKIWSAMKYDLTLPENQLPADLRASLISLANWVEKTSSGILGGRAGVRALTTVNNNIIVALSGQVFRESV